jgi:integrase/recombinase XerD
MFEDTIYSFRKELEVLGYCKKSVTNYPRFVQLFLLHTDEIPQKITQLHIKNYHHYLQLRPNQKRKGELSESHIVANLAAIKTYFNYLQRTNQIKSNPFVLKTKKPLYQVRTVLTQEEIEALYTNCKTIEERMILHLCYGCGLRKSEAQNLNVRDVHFGKKLLYVREGKGKKRRVIPFTQKIAKDFKSYLEERESPLKSSPRRREDGQEEAFLTDNKGERMQGGTIYRLFKNFLKRTGKHSEISLHHLRHSIATHLLENNMSVEMVRDFLGHEQLSTTQIYTRVNLFRNEQRKT